MKGNQTRLSMNSQMHRGQVAVAQEDFWVPADQFVIDPVQQLTGSVPSTYRENCFHIGITEHCMQIVQPLLNCSPDIPKLSANIFAPLWFQSEVLHRAFCIREGIGIRYEGGRRYEADGTPRR